MIYKEKWCLWCEGNIDKYSHLYFECPGTLKLLNTSSISKTIGVQTAITQALWLQWFMTPGMSEMLVRFIRAIYEMNHSYRFSTYFTTWDEEEAIMKAYVIQELQKKHQNFHYFHRGYNQNKKPRNIRYHLDNP